MRPFPLQLTLAISSSLLLGAILVMAPLVIAPALVHATDKTENPATDAANPANAPAPTPRYADAVPTLDTTDEAATLEAVHLALSELGDGASYVWYRRGGRLSGIINPTTSFKDRKGRVCRHLVMTLTAGPHTARTEGIACRLADRSWRLEG